MKYLIITAIAVIVICCACKAQKPHGNILPVDEYAVAFSNDTSAVLIDVRTASEYAEGHIKGALSADVLSEETFTQTVSRLEKNKTYYIYCRSGRRSQTAAVIMEKHGLKVVDLKGGIKAWLAAGKETVK